MYSSLVPDVRHTLLVPGVRPHEVMSPAVSLEETDPTARGLLVQHTYTTTTGQAGREGALPVSPQQVSARTLETHADPVRFRHVSKSLPPGWSYAANSWDRIQSHFLGDPTRAFWLDNAPRVRCPCVDPTEDLVDEVTRREIHWLLCADRLRLPYDKTAPGYYGYRPEWPVGVPMERRLFPPADPRLSSSQAIAAAHTDRVSPASVWEPMGQTVTECFQVHNNCVSRRYEEARHWDSAQPKQAHKIE
ncbi:unnamed protein product [Timema podura]|uniref:Uncharacterized protein n=1 Tax=Timema podura TaxID=61482 RepID=A0ABN7P1B0_TIMPD|nr:unnamed protein product [Timema podura]